MALYTPLLPLTGSMFCLFVGDDLFDKVLLDEESLNIDMVWEVIDWYKQVLNIYSPNFWERSGSLVECLTQDQGAAGLSLTGVTELWFLSNTHLS